MTRKQKLYTLVAYAIKGREVDSLGRQLFYKYLAYHVVGGVSEASSLITRRSQPLSGYCYLILNKGSTKMMLLLMVGCYVAGHILHDKVNALIQKVVDKVKSMV